MAATMVLGKAGFSRRLLCIYGQAGRRARSTTTQEGDRHAGWRTSNWSGCEQWGNLVVAEPESLPQLQETVLCAERIRPLGSGHSFTPLIANAAVPSATLLSLRRMPRHFSLDEHAQTVTVDAGTTYSELCAALSTTPFALSNLASLPHFSIAGAVSTGTHGWQAFSMPVSR